MTGSNLSRQHDRGRILPSADAAPSPSDGERLDRAMEAIEACRIQLATAWSDARQYDGSCGTDGRLQDVLAAATALIGRDEAAHVERQLAELRRPATRREIAVALAGLVAAFPTTARKELQIYGRLLARDVSDAAPSRGALDRACTLMRRTSRFLPAISEVLEAIRGAEEWQRRTPIDSLRTMVRISTQDAARYAERRPLLDKKTGTTVPLIGDENRNDGSSYRR